jgi:hypothetical protein
MASNYNDLAERTTAFLEVVRDRINSSEERLQSAPVQLNAWGEWLEKRSQIKSKAVSGTASRTSRDSHELQKTLETIGERGKAIAAHLEHLRRSESFVREIWLKEDSAHCPTCAADHAAKGGILSALEAVLEERERQREALRNEYLRIKARLEVIQKTLPESAEGACPLSFEGQVTLATSVGWLIPETAAVDQWITVRRQRQDLIRRVAAVRQVPSAPSIVNVEGESAAITKAVASKFSEARETFETPDNWAPVKSKLSTILAEIVAQHLPATLENLWLELTLSLTAAPWLLPERPCIPVTIDRKGRKPTVRVKGRLARYILNQSELHVLGLAWFFARYLTHARFHHASLIMDDPAHELDQTSFRHLCRLWETLIRLHRIYKIPLTLAVMLNQESRAVDAARATGGTLAVLGWSNIQDEPIQATNVIGEGFFAPQPVMLFERATPP